MIAASRASTSTLTSRFCGIAVLFCGFHHLSSQPLLCCCRQSLSPPGIS
ncbi:hypothetical protein [Escherichia coli ISC7]|uniref:Uncharacterized protein n=1 Tax=Escherichia coli ISC7 TaxID=1432555 RepID=W1F5H7_ECOLX|nr:hypothetical protein [Escherichia coli ISC7]